MLATGSAKKVTIYVNEDSKYHHQPLHEAVLEFLLHKGVGGATATRALAGFGGHRVMHTPCIEVLAEHLPILVEFIENPAKVEELLPALHEMVTDGLIEVQDTTIVKIGGREEKAPAPAAHVRKQGPARMMQIFIGEADRCQGVPLYEAIVQRLRTLEVSGATVSRGMLGYGAKGHTHKQSFFHLSKDLPIVISVVDTAEKLTAAAAAIEEMIEDGLIVFSDVEMVRYEVR